MIVTLHCLFFFYYIYINNSPPVLLAREQRIPMFEFITFKACAYLGDATYSDVVTLHALVSPLVKIIKE